MAKKKILLLLFLLSSVAFGLYAAAEGSILTATGRLSLKPRGEEEGLAFLTQEGDSYYIKSGLVEELKSILSDLGENNLVTLSGRKDDSYDISCTNTYKFDAEGNRMVDTLCIRFYHLDVTEIIEAKISDAELPPPKRDIEEEQRARMSALSHLEQPGITQMVEIRAGKVTALNLRSPIKTMEVAFLDKDNQELKKNLLLTSSTRIAKKSSDKEELMYLSVNSLSVGQRVNVIYSRDERKTEALFITITKE